MNQFKGVFLGYHEPPAIKVANVQKCIRVGGKHNDLNIVGTDTYHHTFFEMLGNWSFGDYFKEEACRYAWGLLTEQYGVDKQFLYVTYFAGDERLGLKPDLECKEIWLSLGVAKDKILPFGMEHNFWEMGLTGPCGPCTEIHVDQSRCLANQSERVNKGYPDLTEIWNIVFIQYQRLSDDTVTPLSKYHIDTGLGFERLVALLQGKRSNYDTDLFEPLFKAIQRFTKVPSYQGRFNSEDKNGLDCSYRTLADHARMISIALADGIMPEENNKLRRVIRKAIDVGEKVFNKSGILFELSFTVMDILGDTYPELQTNLKQVQKIIQFEEDLLKRMQKTSFKEWQKIVQTRPVLSSISNQMSSGLVQAYKELQSVMKDLRKTNIFPISMAIDFYTTHGLDMDMVIELAEIESLMFDKIAYQNEMENLKYQTKLGIKNCNYIDVKRNLALLEENGIPKTDDSFKYQYTFDGHTYQFPPVTSRIVGLLINGNLVYNKKQVEPDVIVSTTDKTDSDNNHIGIILDKTLCYSLEGGQTADSGYIAINNNVFHIDDVRKINGYIIHFGQLIDNSKKAQSILNVGDECMVSINSEKRIAAMRNHTAIHLLNAALKKVIQVVYQIGASAKERNFTFFANSFGHKLSIAELTEIEMLINTVIKANVPVETQILNLSELLGEDNVTLLPGEIYPYSNIRIVDICANNIKSREACCGTHVHNTSILEHFCFVKYLCKSANKLYFKALTGPLAVSAKYSGEEAIREVQKLEKKVNLEQLNYEEIISQINKLKRRLIDENMDHNLLPYTIQQQSLEKLTQLGKSAWDKAKDYERESVHAELKDLSESQHLIVHCLYKDLTCLSLNEVISFYPTLPIFLMIYSKGNVKARCYIPQHMVSNSFNAQSWLNVALQIFNGENSPIGKFNPLLYGSMKSKPLNDDKEKAVMPHAISQLKEFALKHVKISKVHNKIN
ncbi:hypothetical protein KM043_015879 [Ampulex compressa]|nr:hypothetical protein KM043_015879 [Ampulex compressa]